MSLAKPGVKGTRHTLCTLRPARILKLLASQRVGRLMECQSHLASSRRVHLPYADLN